MSIHEWVFYGFAAVLIFAAAMVVFSRHPVRGVLFLVLAFFCSAVLWMLLQAEFLSLVLIFVYIGAVMTLFLFVVMMINIDAVVRKSGFVRYLPFGLLVLFILLGVMASVLGSAHFDTAQLTEFPADYNNVKALGRVLYTEYFYAFEIVAVLLLVAIISAISLAWRGEQKRKAQSQKVQIATTKKERLQIIKG